MIKNKHIIPLIALTACLGACTMSQVYDETPYENRTASESETVYKKRERMHKKQKIHAQCKTDCTIWRQRAMQAEERADRLESQLQQTYRK